MFFMMSTIKKIIAREVLDSRGFPTVEAELLLENGNLYRSIVPSGSSTGSHEALELRDNNKSRYHGKGVLASVDNVNNKIAPVFTGKKLTNYLDLDKELISLDSDPLKKNLGANSILAVSLVLARAFSGEQGITLSEWINKIIVGYDWSPKMSMPVPLMNVINGGAHANNGLDIQEFMIVPHGFSTFSESLRAGSEIFHFLKKQLDSDGHSIAVGDEGGFAPSLENNQQAIEYILRAIEKSGYKIGEQISLALDVAATEFYDDKNKLYKFKDPLWGEIIGSDLINKYDEWVKKYPLISIEDAASEDDWLTWHQLTEKLGSKVQIVGDDLFVTQKIRLIEGLEKKAANALLVKFNQVGSLSETFETMALTVENNFNLVVSHRSGESEDTFISHLAVGSGAGQIKTGSLSRTDRIAKYNELLRIEEKLNLPLAKIQFE